MNAKICAVLLAVTPANDWLLHSPMVEKGGPLVMDDACCDMDIPRGLFPGLAEVTDAVKDLLPDREDEHWKFEASLCHIKLFRRK